jgi:hypothetical protein
VFFVNVPIGLALLLSSYRLLPPDPPPTQGGTDVPGAVTVTAGVAFVVLAITRAGDTLSAVQPLVLGLIGAGFLVAFVARERRAKPPLLDLALFKDRRIDGANLSLFGLGAFNAGEVLLVTLYLQEARNLSPLVTGLCFIPQAAGALLLSGPASRIVPMLGPRRALALAMTIALIALVGGALAIAAGNIPSLLVTLLLLGISARLVQVAGTLAGTAGPVAARSEGTASALLTATRQVGSAVGVAVVSATLVAARGTTAHRTAVAMFVAAGFAAAALVSTRLIPSNTVPHPKPKPEHLFLHRCGGVA